MYSQEASAQIKESHTSIRWVFFFFLPIYLCLMCEYFEVNYGKFKEIEFSHFRLHDTDRQTEMKMNETMIEESEKSVRNGREEYSLGLRQIFDCTVSWFETWQMGRASIQNEYVFIEHMTDDIIFSRFSVLRIDVRIARITSIARFKPISLSRRFERWNFYDFTYKLGEKYINARNSYIVLGYSFFCVVQVAPTKPNHTKW